jgi:hypothetical protein
MRGLVYREAKKGEDDGEAGLVCFGCNRERNEGKMERRQCVEAVRVAGSAGGEEGAGLRVLQNGDEEEKRSWFGFKGRGRPTFVNREMEVSGGLG